ncbi:MAG: hypothetical protein H6978_07145 [Gammaproteobacteria bacterium]|nr:hypothetical protein [Gammaproteobacteria bacterium]
MTVRYLYVSLFVLLGAGPVSATVYGGIDFPAGEVSFADSVVAYRPGLDVTFGGGWDDPVAALGPPDDGPGTGPGDVVSLGDGGILTLQFTDNSLTASGDAWPDLHVFEVGTVTEIFNVAISADGNDWIDLGNVQGQPTSIDIDANPRVQYGVQYIYVRLSDVPPNQSGAPFGEADIDAVGAISSAPPVTVVPLPPAWVLFGSVMVGWHRLKKWIVSS